MTPDEGYKQIGRFVVGFQNVEAALIDIACLLLDGARTPRAEIVLSRLSFKNLTDATEAMLIRFVDERSFTDGEQRRTDFHVVSERCRGLGNRRNALVHSTYAHLMSGDTNTNKGLLRSRSRLRIGGAQGARHESEEEVLTASDLEGATGECQQLATELDGFRLWLIAHSDV